MSTKGFKFGLGVGDLAKEQIDSVLMFSLTRGLDLQDVKGSALVETVGTSCQTVACPRLLTQLWAAGSN